MSVNFTTIVLGNKKRQVRLRAEANYDPFRIFPYLQDVKNNNAFCVDEGDMFYDFIGDQGPLRFISEKFKDLLESSGVKGVSFIPIKIKDSKLQYYAFVETQIKSKVRFRFRRRPYLWYIPNRFYFMEWRRILLSERQRGNGLFFES